MDTLTKIFVVVVVVLILLACPVIINVIATHENYRELLEQEQQRSTVLELTARTANLSNEVAIARQEETRRRLDNAESQHEQALNRAEGRYNEERLARAELRRSYDTVAAQLVGLNSSLESSIELRKQLSEQLEAERRTANRLRQEQTELADALRDAEARADRLTTLNRGLREDLEASRRRVSELEDRLARVDPRDERREPVARPDLDITAEVTAVDGNIIGINIGAAQGIEENMEMIIYRDADLVAELRIDEVHTGSAAGIITTRLLDPRPGDKVTTPN